MNNADSGPYLDSSGFEANVMLLVDDSEVDLSDRRRYENTVAAQLSKELPVRMMGGDEYDLTVDVPPAPSKRTSAA